MAIFQGGNVQLVKSGDVLRFSKPMERSEKMNNSWCVRKKEFENSKPHDKETVRNLVDREFERSNQFMPDDTITKSNTQLKYKPIDPEEKAWVFGHNDKVPEDIVNHPSHYETGKFECFDVMREAFGDDAVKNFCICNAFKYLYRHQRKNGIEDIRKAKWYIDHFLEIID